MNKENACKLWKMIQETGRYNWKLRFAPSCSTRVQNKDSQGYFLLGVEENILKKINY